MSLYMRNNTLPTVIENDDDDDCNNNQNKIKNPEFNSSYKKSDNNSFEYNEEFGENITIVDDYDDNYNIDDTFETSNVIDSNSLFNDFEMNEKMNSKILDLGLKRGSSRNRSSARSSNYEDFPVNLNNSKSDNENDSDATSTTPSIGEDYNNNSNNNNNKNKNTDLEENNYNDFAKEIHEDYTSNSRDEILTDENKLDEEIKNVETKFYQNENVEEKLKVVNKKATKNKLIIRLDGIKSQRAKSSFSVKRNPEVSKSIMSNVLADRDEINSKRHLAKSQPSLSNSSLGKNEHDEIEQEQSQQKTPSQSRLLIRKQQSSLRIRNSAGRSLETPMSINKNDKPVTAPSTTSSVSTPLSTLSAKKNEKMPITVDTSKSNSNLEVVRLCINELGWLEMPNGSPSGCDIYWHSSTYHEGFYGSKFNCAHSGRINKFPCMNQLLRKAPLTLALNVMRSVYPEQYEFYPRTWFLPEQFQDFKTDCKYIHEKQTKLGKPLTAFIVKPNDGSQGEGIYLITNPNDFLSISTKNTWRSYIVQEYIDNPYLIDGLKSDLRIYVVLASLKPLEIYICDEGLVRFATVNYETPDDSNLKQVYMHLTNYSLNKKNESYKFTSDKSKTTSNSDLNEEKGNEGVTGSRRDQIDSEGQGSKRKLTQVFEKMEKSGIKTKRLRAAIDDLVIKTLFALLPEMKVEHTYEILPASTNNVGPSCFQIFGFDILLTSELKPMLLEVNCNPSLRIDYEIEDPTGRLITLPSPIDSEIKKPLVLQTLKLIAPQKKLDMIERHKFQEEREEKAAKYRDQLAKERVKERLITLKKEHAERKQLDLNKCPLLSRPARELRQNNIMQSLYTPQLSSSSSSFDHYNQSSNYFQSDGYYEPDFFDNYSKTAVDNNKKRGVLRKLYPIDKTKTQYSYLNLLENVSDIFTYIAITKTTKVMNQTAFRTFIKKCYLINEKTTSDNLDILYHDTRKKWSRYNRRKDVALGLCCQAFMELFFTLSKIHYPEYDLEESLKSLVFHCIYYLKLDGLKTNDYCTMSRNGPILMVDQRVMVKIAQIDEMRRHEARVTRTLSTLRFDLDSTAISTVLDNKSSNKKLNLNKNNDNTNVTSSLNLNRELAVLRPTQRIKSKKSVFPIYF